jgi:hypothetical protein
MSYGKEERVATGQQAPPPPVMNVTAPQIQTTTQNMQAPAAQGEVKATEAGEPTGLSDSQFYMQTMRDMQREMQQLQQQIASLLASQTASNAADTLPTPMSTFRQAHFSTRTAQPRRVSFGMPSLEESPPATPASTRQEQEAVSVEITPGASTATAADRAVLKDALSMAKGHVEPFYADTAKDKGTTVTDFVEKIESIMGDCGLPASHRLTMVRWFLREGALRWTNRKLNELNLAAEKEGRDLAQHPIDWDHDVRSAFIRAHVGTDTVDAWLSKLSALRLGKGKGAAATPIELEAQFNTISRHVYPHYVADDDRSELLLASKYSEIILRSQPKLYEQILLSQPQLVTLKDWKEALVRVWAVQERLQAVQTTQQTGGTWSSWSGYRGRGRGGHNPSSGRGDSKQHALNSTEADTNTREEGQELPTDAASDPQLSAAAGSSQRGGRGGRGGRGRGLVGHPSQWSAEQERLYAEHRCFYCKEVGHSASECPKRAASKEQQQSKEKAGQQ